MSSSSTMFDTVFSITGTAGGTSSIGVVAEEAARAKEAPDFNTEGMFDRVEEDPTPPDRVSTNRSSVRVTVGNLKTSDQNQLGRQRLTDVYVSNVESIL